MKPNHSLTDLLKAHRETIQAKLRYEQANDSNIASNRSGAAWHQWITDLERELSSVNYWIAATAEPPSLFEQVIGITKQHDEVVARTMGA